MSQRCPMNERLGGFHLPWCASSPRALVNWWDMQQFHAEKFCNIMSHVAGLGARLAMGDREQYIPETVRKDVISKLLQVAITCRSIELVVAPLQIDAT